MDFLKEILGEELFNQVAKVINEYNGDETHKDKQVKLANLGEGKYVSKDKYAALETSLTGKQTELDKANQLIEDLRKGTKDNETLQNQIIDYDNQVKVLQGELAKTKLKAAIKVALLNEQALDIDYLTYKLETDDKKTLELDDNDNIKDWKDIVTGLKTQYPNQFEGKGMGNVVDPKPLPQPDPQPNPMPTSLADALKQNYEHKGE